jgi:hypothetical protein
VQGVIADRIDQGAKPFGMIHARRCGSRSPRHGAEAPGGIVDQPAQAQLATQLDQKQFGRIGCEMLPSLKEYHPQLLNVLGVERTYDRTFLILISSMIFR